MKTSFDPRTEKDSPREGPGSAQPLEGWSAERGWRGRAVVVDDDLLVRLVLAEALESRGFEALVAEDGVAGLQLLSETILTVDVVITDVLMPGLDGIELVRTIRDAGGESELCVVAVTSIEDPLHWTLLYESGADLVLQKDLGPAAIAAAVEEAVLGSNATRGRAATM